MGDAQKIRRGGGVSYAVQHDEANKVRYNEEKRNIRENLVGGEMGVETKNGRKRLFNHAPCVVVYFAVPQPRQRHLECAPWSSEYRS